MLYISENLKALRKKNDWTQEEVAEMVGVSPQSVSKWERGDTYPDITLLPALANLYKVSVDSIIGMDKINEAAARTAVFTEGQGCLRNGDLTAAAKVYTDALKIFPADEAFMSELAMVLALESEPAKIKQAAELCERVLSGNPSEKVRHTTRAAICFIYYKLGEKERAVAAAKNLPHLRESRENVVAVFRDEPDTENINAYIRFMALGNEETPLPIVIQFSVNLWTPLYVERELVNKVQALRAETATQKYRLPTVNIRDNPKLPRNGVRVLHYAECLLDKVYENPDEALEEVLETLRRIAPTS